MMDLTGEGFLALWNGAEPERIAEYDLWHSREHVPERLAIDGMLSARRYLHRDGPLHGYFTLYNTRDAAVLNSAPYRRLLENPSPWSRSMRPSFRGFFRIGCSRIASAGGGIGAELAVTVVAGPALRRPEAVEALTGLVADTPLTAVHVLGKDPAIPPAPFTIGGAQQLPPDDGVLLFECYGEAALDHALPQIERRLDALGLGAARAHLTRYALGYALDRGSLTRIATVAPETAADRGIALKEPVRK